MIAKKAKYKVINKPLGLAGYAFIIYWGFFAFIYISTDLFIDLFTDIDYTSVFWYTAFIVLPVAAYTTYLARETFLTKWYTYILYPVLFYGLYLGSAYFTALKLDLLLSAAIKPEIEQVLPIENVKQVFARRAGFVYTDVRLRYQERTVNFEGTRSSYFLLKHYKLITAKVGQSYLGSYYITDIDVTANERWVARFAYLKDWFHRCIWLLIVLPSMFMFTLFKDKIFPANPADVKAPRQPYIKFLRTLFIILGSFLGLFILVLLLVGIFAP